MMTEFSFLVNYHCSYKGQWEGAKWTFKTKSWLHLVEEPLTNIISGKINFYNMVPLLKVVLGRMEFSKNTGHMENNV